MYQTFRVETTDYYGDVVGKTMVTRKTREGTFMLGIYGRKNSFLPAHQWSFKTHEDAVRWAQQAWTCGETFDV